ncbi:MAG TPA: transketolase C-terminal domain-containing protein [Solirubrobacteraceae bacterium]|nr:transketolase C-terminal domain-containing protein [Solirubrobacteraceae bacterium]
MRNAFIGAVQEIAERDRRVVFLTGDLGFMVLEPLAERLRERFVNVGVAEQNMIGLATGLAEAGLVPFVYSIGTFASMRPYELIRDGPLLHSLPVRIIGVGAGLDYGHNGVTHYALEDVAIMRAQPDMTIIAPADPAQAAAAAHASTAIDGPIYFRIGKTGAAVAGLDGRFELGRLELIGEGRDVAIVALGSIAAEAVQARALVERQGIEATVAVVASVQPAPTEDLIELLEDRPLAITVEAHYHTGGLGSLVAEVIAEHGLACRLARIAVERMPRGQTGSLAFLNDAHRLCARAIAATIAAEPYHTSRPRRSSATP